MWTQLFFASVLAICLAYAPGFMFARALGARAEYALGVAPVLTIVCYGAVSVVYGLLGIPCSWLTLGALWTIVGAGVWALAARRRHAQAEDGSIGQALGFSSELERPLCKTGVLSHLSAVRLAMTLAVAAGVATSLAVYVANIGDANAFIQNYDNAFHVNRIHEFAQTGVYLPLTLGTFYPSAWHVIGAMVESALGISPMMAEHAANLAFIAAVFPLSSVVLLSTLFPNRPRAVWMGGALCLSFGFFPWRIMLFGPLYPNLSSFALMPAVAALFIMMWKKGISRSVRVRYVALFVAGGVAMALAQPNAIFSTGAFLIPFCVWRAYGACYDALEGRRHRAIVALAVAFVLALVFAACWYLLSQAPFMRGVVYYPRETRLDVPQAIRWALGFSFVLKRQQYLIGAVVALGGIVLLARSKVRWVPVSYAMLVMLYVVCISVAGPVRNVLTGYWYNDFYRLAATVCVFAVPLVAVGMDAVASTVERALAKRPRAGHAMAFLAVVVIMAINYVPFSFIPQYYRSYGHDAVSFEMRDMYQSEANQILTADEIAFCERVAEVVPTGEEVYNVPFDGSVFAYAACNLNVVYRSFGHEPSADAVLLHERLSVLAQDEEVRAAAKGLGVRYVLQLDQGTSETGFGDSATVSTLGYDPEEWRGINVLSDDTPGFECILSEGDMRLYRIQEQA